MPASALAYVSVNADLESAQWELLREHARRFPDSGRARRHAPRRARRRGRRLGARRRARARPGGGCRRGRAGRRPRAGAGVRDAVRRRGEAGRAARTLTGRDGRCARRSTAGRSSPRRPRSSTPSSASSTQGRLSDDDEFTSAVAELPEEALLKLYVDGEAVTQAGARVRRAERGARPRPAALDRGRRRGDRRPGSSSRPRTRRAAARRSAPTRRRCSTACRRACSPWRRSTARRTSSTSSESVPGLGAFLPQVEQARRRDAGGPRAALRRRERAVRAPGRPVPRDHVATCESTTPTTRAARSTGSPSGSPRRPTGAPARPRSRARPPASSRSRASA